MQVKKLLLLALAGAFTLGASAQWQWIDKDGRKVFSDRPPPQDVPDRNILKQPHQRAATFAPAAAPAPQDGTEGAGAAGEPAPPQPSRQDKELEAKKAKAEAAEAARLEAEEKARAERAARLRAENCTQARRMATTLGSGAPLAHINAQGERVVMDDATRAAELRRAQSVIASDCR
ncbi:DUF4124 domain-containing protein [Melaminivora alkalimesophila]|uniref:Uncharacterized protein DUF4124 n=1 Tax=Melaminivora alkalimesophila TaxID=1165852 RepID=A0A317RG80_9BURK|nr:DUF4124 domain-containing protein [Melaminivora alkalimesophila]PWW48919.1 uncharacterized protein DUF4124 [Melaminivora alkalimesophila]